jgi:outer membrane protein assembly factor BamB
MKNHRTLLLFLCVAFTTSVHAADWNQWRGPNRDGFAPDSPPLIKSLPATGLKPLWVSDLKVPSARDGGWGSPIVAGGNVYVFTHQRVRTIQGDLPAKKYPYLAPEKRAGMTDEEYAEYERNRRDEDEARAKIYRFDEVTFCLKAESGKLNWENKRNSVYSRFPQSGSPAVVDGRLYILGAGRVARCIDAVTGQDIWEKQLPGEFRDEFLQSSFAVTEGVAVVLCGWLFGLDASTGEILWQGDEGKTRGTHTSPAIWRHGGHSYIIANVGGNKTICVEPRTGKQHWEIQSEAGNSTPVLVGDRLLTYGSSRKKGLRCFAITPEGAEQLWIYQGSADSGSSPVVVGDYVYLQGERRLACVSIANGKAQWTATLDISRPRYTSLVAADNLVVYAFDGVLGFSASPDRFEQRMNAKIDENGLLADESVFRKLLRIDELEKTAEGQKQAEKLWRKKFNGNGTLSCSSPAISGGKLFLRLQNSVACYDFAEVASD